MSRYRYGAYRDGPDPLSPPYDVRDALDAMGDAVLEGTRPDEALRDLLRRGLPGEGGRRGLDDLLRQVRERRRALRDRGRLDGTLEQARALLDTAIGQERAELFPDPGDDARLREAELDTLPEDTSQAIRRLSDYQWRSPAARETFDRLRDLLRSEVLDAQFQGMKQALQGQDPRSMERVKDMMAALNRMLDRDARGEHTQEDFERFMAEYGDMFGAEDDPDRPRDLEELVDSLARRAAATDRLLASLSPEQRAELAGLMDQVMQDAGLALEMSRLGDSLRARRPDLGWGTPEQMTGDAPLGVGDATTALAELADLAELESALGQDYPGARLDDVDEEAVRRALGRQAVDDLGALRRIEAELERQGYLQRRRGTLELTPKAVRRLGETALRRVFSRLTAGRQGDHDQRDAGQAGELTGSSRAWRFGDEQPLDVVRTVGNAIRRSVMEPGAPAAVGTPGSGAPGSGTSGSGTSGAGTSGPPRSGAVRLSVDDFEVHETERRTGAAVCLLVDLSYSMVLRGTWAAAKQTTLALHTLVTSKFPQDAIQIIGFSNYARTLHPTEMAGLDWDMVQGTNLHHALMIAGRHLDRHPDFEPIVLVVTDGEPTAHLRPDGRSLFDYPPSTETLVLTLAEVDKMTRRSATMNFFMLAEDRRLVSFVEEVARRNGGRVFAPDADRLGEYVVSDYLRVRRGRR
ncbi:hypothetical protein [Actinomadura xylanilytica]|uniref:hypothetical protein n=1 Tax=Actinomadura xylanilytica TaxID=887459 RepID=UPI00255B1F1C|nr:hypothetical protein [Actinomadura xylanilytica]MDL4772291.1 hypothetical protein [Actinomadura xylanilytica]